MKKYLIAFFIFLLPAIHIFSNPILSSKWEMLQEAKNHKKKAQSHLLMAEELCYLIPDPGKRQHMFALIASTMTTLNIPDIKAKFLTVGLTLIGSLSTDIYENYCDWRTHLYQAAYHLEMANFYNSISIRFADSGNLSTMDKGTRAFLKAIDNLTIAEMLAWCIEDEDDQAMISDVIVEQRSTLISKFKNPKSTIPDDFYEDAYNFSENIDEITADLSDEEIRDSICVHVYAMAEDIELACRYWYGDLMASN